MINLEYKNEDYKKQKFDSSSFDEELSFLSLNYGEFAAEVSFELPIYPEYQNDDYELHLFFNDYLNAENDIFQLYDYSSKARIGWIFPMQALVSNEHDFADNEHFLKYAYVAFKKMLNGESTIQHKAPLINGKLELTDFYHEKSIVLILCKDKIQDIDSFSIDHYLCSLAKFGYYNASHRPNKIETLHSDIESYYLQFRGNTRLTISKTLEDFRSDDYIIELYKNLLYKSTHHLVKFHILYQVIELLMEIVFSDDFDSSLEDFQNGKISQFELREKVAVALNEKERIGKVFDKYNEAASANMLHQNCNILLSKIETEKDHVSKSLYRVRNNIVHSYRKISAKNEHLFQIELINLYLELYISNLLTK